MESHGQAHKCIIVKSGEKKLTPLVLGELFEVNSPTSPLSSNYYLFRTAVQDGEGGILGSRRLRSFHSPGPTHCL